jgi:phage terminase small subunit
MINWEEIKKEYIKNLRTKNISIIEFAEKFGINCNTLKSRARRGLWNESAPKYAPGDAPKDASKKVCTETELGVNIKDHGKNHYMHPRGDDASLNATQLRAIQEQAKRDAEGVSELLTGKQIIFCYEFIIDFNATRSAIVAGYSKKTARQMGSENLAKPYIITEIRRLQIETMKSLPINPEKIIMEHMKISFADITTYMDIGRKEQTFFDDNGKKYKAMADYAHLKEGILIDGSVISEIQVSKDTTKIKMQDKFKSLEFLAKYAQLGQDYHKQMIEMEKLTIMKERFKLELERNVSDNDNGNLQQLINAIHKTDNKALSQENNLFGEIDAESETND